MNIFVRIPYLFQERINFIANVIISLFIPANHIKLIYGNANLCHSEGPCNYSVIFSWSIFKSRLETMSWSINHKNSALCLARTSYHVWNEVFMARCIDNREIFVLRLEKCLSCIDCDSSSSLFLIFIHNICKLKGLFSILLRYFCIFVHLLFVNYAQFKQQMSHQCTFACINMPYHDHIYLSFEIWLVQLNIIVDCWVLGVKSFVIYNFLNNLFIIFKLFLFFFLLFLIIFFLIRSFFLFFLLLFFLFFNLLFNFFVNLIFDISLPPRIFFFLFQLKTNHSLINIILICN